jgi:hypothetical protein
MLINRFDCLFLLIESHNSLLLSTGLWPFYDEFSHSTLRKRVMKGEWPYVDPRYRTRSYIENRLVEVMEKTWAYYPQDRASIFEVVQHLQETAVEWNKRQRGESGNNQKKDGAGTSGGANKSGTTMRKVGSSVTKEQ